jgi:dTDP-4-dehydrorhamnose reductase
MAQVSWPESRPYRRLAELIRLCVRLGFILVMEITFTPSCKAQIDAGKTLCVTADQKGCPTRAENLATHLLTEITNQQIPTGHFALLRK